MRSLASLPRTSRLAALPLLTLLLGACAGMPVWYSPARVAPYGTTPAGSLPTGFPATCGENQVQVMLLGTFHFEGSETDAVSGTPQDVRTPRRQAELEDLAERLARWDPQQVAVEWPLSFADSTTAWYRRFVARGGQSTSQNEVVQVGFRLAHRLGHPTVYPIDHQMPLGNDSIAALLARRPDLRRNRDRNHAALQAESRAEERAHAELSLVERLRILNGEDALHRGNSGAMFGSWLGAGEGTNRGGPQLLARWYERNIYMVHNLTRILLPGTQRVVVVVGTGHVPPMRNILDESPDFCPVSPLPWLAP